MHAIKFVDKLAVLADHCGRPEFKTPIVVRRRGSLFGVISHTKFDCKLWVSMRGDCWGVMYSTSKNPHRRPTPARPFLGADFRKNDGGRETAWTMVAKTWLPVFVDDEATPIFERIEDAVTRAYESLQGQAKPQ
jgi:hypothetical protein